MIELYHNLSPYTPVSNPGSIIAFPPPCCLQLDIYLFSYSVPAYFCMFLMVSSGSPRPTPTVPVRDKHTSPGRSPGRYHPPPCHPGPRAGIQKSITIRRRRTQHPPITPLSAYFFAPAMYICAHLCAFARIFGFFTYVFAFFFTPSASGGPNFPPKSV